MYRCQLCLPINFYFPTIRAWRNTSMLATMLPSYVNCCRKPLKRLRYSPCQRQRDRNGTMIEKLMLFHWNQVTWSWQKLILTEGGRKWRDWWDKEPYKVDHQVAEGIPSYLVKEPADRMLMSPPLKLTFSHCSYKEDSSLYDCAYEVGQVHHHHPRGTNSWEEWRLKKCHKMWIVCCWPSIRQMRLL